MVTLAKESLGNPRWFEQLDEPGDEPDNPLAGTRPVSYTHLDVYKRQGLASAACSPSSRMRPTVRLR